MNKILKVRLGRDELENFEIGTSWIYRLKFPLKIQLN